MINDSFMQVHLLNDLTLQQRAWAGMHQCYSSCYVWEEIQENGVPSDREAGERVVKHLLAGDRGHYGPLEELGITVACGYIPHSVMQQLRTHRISVTFDCQSFRYTSQGLLDVASRIGPALDLGHDPDVAGLESLFYLRPVGSYRDRTGVAYEYTQADREEDLSRCWDALRHYARRLEKGFSPEQARGLLPFDYRQHFVMSFNNIRSLWHMLDLRLKRDAQDEAQHVMQLIWEATKDIAPELSAWYESSRSGRARLAP